ncbi:hypothetical protein Pfo_016403 [Paulownia fortunei]|nr:hypothetical protein Pfo_016403 [Paulownia fortunei]
MKAAIYSIQHDGQLINDTIQIKDSTAKFFQDYLTGGNANPNCDLLDFFQSLINHEDNLRFYASPSMEDIRQVVFSIHPKSMAGPNGLASLFFQQCWGCIKGDLLDACTEFFNGGSLQRRFMTTSIVFFPKIEKPSRWTDFRPINLCNVNKIFSKLLSSKFAEFLLRLISHSQSGFVQWRAIADNVLLAQETIYSIDNKCKDGNMVIKLDMAKAYDRIQWIFFTCCTPSIWIWG